MSDHEDNEMTIKDRLFAALLDHSGYALLDGELGALMDVVRSVEMSAARRCAEIAMECSANIEQWRGLLCIAQAQVPASDAVDAIKRTSEATAAAIRSEFGLGKDVNDE